jgi:hypothetical protein
MICKKYEALSPNERVLLIGKIVHLVQNSNAVFITAERIIKKYEDAGAFDNVTILPENIPIEDIE